jgi:hypothetical protein
MRGKTLTKTFPLKRAAQQWITRTETDIIRAGEAEDEPRTDGVVKVAHELTRTLSEVSRKNEELMGEVRRLRADLAKAASLYRAQSDQLDEGAVRLALSIKSARPSAADLDAHDYRIAVRQMRYAAAIISAEYCTVAVRDEFMRLAGFPPE